MSRSLAATLASALLIAGVPSASLAQSSDSSARKPSHARRAWVAGAVASYLLHEAGHVGASLALGAHPRFEFDRGRPTVFSGIDMTREPHKQLVFSSMGLVVQAVIDEAVLDLPGAGDSPFARGMLASGLGTALFYITAGRNGAVSDVSLISRTSGMTKGRVSLIVGAVAALHATRFAARRGLGALFVLPDADGRLRIGVWR